MSWKTWFGLEWFGYPTVNLLIPSPTTDQSWCRMLSLVPGFLSPTQVLVMPNCCVVDQSPLKSDLSVPGGVWVWVKFILLRSFHQWPFQDPKLEVPTVYKAYFLGLCKGISPQNMAKNMVLTYLQFRILEISHWFQIRSVCFKLHNGALPSSTRPAYWNWRHVPVKNPRMQRQTMIYPIGSMYGIYANIWGYLGYIDGKCHHI